MAKASKRSYVPSADTRSNYDYIRWLDNRWVAACAKRASDAPSIISTFAGCGGSSLGYAMAGFNELMVVEWDDHAVEVFRHNFVNGPIGGDHAPIVYHGDITTLTHETILEACDLKPGELDIFDGSPPCQGFSTSGKRVIEDDRNFLFMHFARLTGGLKPKAFVMENVVGMTQGRMKPTFQKAIDVLAEQGYRVAVRILDASWLGIPQARKRTIFIGVRNDLKVNPAHLFPKPWPFRTTLRDGIADLADEPGPHCAPAGKTKELMKYIRPGRKGTDVLGLQSGFDLKREHWNRPTRTFLKTHSPRMYAGVIHPDRWRNRYMGIHEIKRIGAFPDAYEFGTEDPDWWAGEAVLNPRAGGPDGAEKDIRNTWARIGNSVPPLMMYEIASSIRAGLL